ncbi:hypothetical protein WKI71_08715 [Streptomyces sp. MS1.AVA.1]|uniref:NUDIX hydrolase n=1 Tax=Streptomyces machairae TaxID=3134109 RepID=A0ABU8UI22_9ACTN
MDGERRDRRHRPRPGEVAEARWVTPEEFLSLDPVFEGDREFFERILPTL